MLFGILFRKNISKLSDLDLVQQIDQSGNEVLGEIFKRYAVLVNGVCLKYLKDPAKAEDLMMEIFEKLSAKIKKSEIGNFKPWLYQVTKNECLMTLRKTKKEQSGDLDKALIFEQDESELNLNAVLIKETKLNLLEEAIGELKEDQKKCIELFYLSKKSYDEVAIISGLDLKKVKSHIQNGKRNLKLILEQKSEFK